MTEKGKGEAAFSGALFFVFFYSTPRLLKYENWWMKKEKWKMAKK